MLELGTWWRHAWVKGHFLFPWMADWLRRGAPAQRPIDLTVDLFAINGFVLLDRFPAERMRQ